MTLMMKMKNALKKKTDKCDEGEEPSEPTSKHEPPLVITTAAVTTC